MKLVIAGVDEHGHSFVESTQELDGKHPMYLWNGAFDGLSEAIAHLDESAHAAGIEPVPGGIKWVFNTWAPASPNDDPTHAARHVTRTVDLDYVVSGRMQCILDDQTVELEAGDFIALKAAPHTWHNASGAPTTMLYILHRPADVTD